MKVILQNKAENSAVMVAGNSPKAIAIKLIMNVPELRHTVNHIVSSDDLAAAIHDINPSFNVSIIDQSVNKSEADFEEYEPENYPFLNQTFEHSPIMPNTVKVGPYSMMHKFGNEPASHIAGSLYNSLNAVDKAAVDAVSNSKNPYQKIISAYDYVTSRRYRNQVQASNPQAPSVHHVARIYSQMASSIHDLHAGDTGFEFRKSGDTINPAVVGGHFTLKDSDVKQIGHAMLGNDLQSRTFLAAAKLAGVKPDEERIRRALWNHEDDLEAAALESVGLAVTDENKKALAAVSTLEEMKKAEEEGGVKIPKSIEPATDSASAMAEEVINAYKSDSVQPIHLQGKHSKGTVLAKDPRTLHIYLLKPGSGSVSPAKGVKQEGASQSAREAAFSEVAQNIRLGPYVVNARMLLVDGQQWAGMNLIPFDYKTADERRRKHSALLHGVMGRYAKDGMAHKWGVLDYILGNPDRHAQNIMVGDNGHVVLIDHGSAFAGSDFSPGTDENSFVPFYLRYATSKFNTLNVQQKLQTMPSLDFRTEENLYKWIQSISSESVRDILLKYGIDPTETLKRIKIVQELPRPIDQSLNKLWLSK
jgi:hypothetical protein